MSEIQYASEADLFPKAYQRRYDDVYLPIANVTVCIRSLTAAEVDRWQMVEIARDNRNIVRSRIEDRDRRLIVLCLVDKPDGNLLLNPSHVPRMATLWDNADIAVLAQACIRFSGASQVDADAEGKAVKNSPPTGGEESSSDSPDVAA